MSDEITNRFENFVARQGWNPAEHLTVLAVSGGLDSMTMATLFHDQQWPVVIAHINFGLRGAESDADEEWVRRWAEQRELLFYTIRFDTAAMAAARGQGIQETARQLRYHWLGELRKKLSAGWIATAHHLNDSVETMLFHQLRGCGLRGLHGIPVQNGHIIRPLLEFTRRELEVFASEREVIFCTDASNLSLTYTRNHIRHRVLPALQEVNPDFIKTAAANMQRYRGAEALVDWAVDHWRKRLFRPGPLPEITRMELSAMPSDEVLQQFLLYELLHPRGFSADQIRQLGMPPHQTGAFTESDTHQLQYDRGALLLSEKRTRIGEEVRYVKMGQEVCRAGENRLHLEDVHIMPTSLPNDPGQFFVRRDRLRFPLQLRAWRAGDVFHPLGMDGQSKKVKKFFADEKIPRLQKERTWLLVNADGRLIWLVGLRGDERFRAQPGKPAVRFYWNRP